MDNHVYEQLVNALIKYLSKTNNTLQQIYILMNDFGFTREQLLKYGYTNQDMKEYDVMCNYTDNNY